MSTAGDAVTVDVAALSRLMPPGAVRTDAETLATYGRDWLRIYEPRASAVVFPASTRQVADLVKWARATATPLVPSGGRTGLSGGATATRGEVVVSMDQLDALGAVDVENATVAVGAGVTIARVHAAAAAAGLLYPVDFAPTETMQVGGNIATNAGGVRVIRYGSTRQWVAGLTAVIGTGEVLDLSVMAPKNNTGYDLRQLLIGSEGTLGIITAATLRLTRRPGETAVMAVSLGDESGLAALLARCAAFGPLTAFEFMDDAVVRLAGGGSFGAAAVHVLAEFELPLEAVAPWAAGEGGVAVGGDSAEAKAMWDVRLALGSAVAPFTPYKNDVAVPTSAVGAFLREARALLAASHPGWRVVAWGHLGDGNVHINCLKPDDLPLERYVAECARVDEVLYALVARLRGSISAEHGVGLSKKAFLRHSRSELEIGLMRQIKAAFDPAGILNPGKIFDSGGGA